MWDNIIQYSDSFGTRRKMKTQTRVWLLVTYAVLKLLFEDFSSLNFVQMLN